MKKGECRGTSDRDREKHMKKTIAVLTLCAALFAFCVSSEAQQPKKVPRIGVLTGGSALANRGRHEAFRQGLGELGYVEAKSIILEWRNADGQIAQLPALAAELVRLKVDVIVTAGPQVTRVVKDATSTIPIVMAFDNDPVGSGHIGRLARPGGNITGLSTLSPELTGKQLELLKEVVLRLSHVGVIGTSTQPGYAQVAKEIDIAAGTLGVKLHILDVLNTKDIESAFRKAIRERAEAVVVLASAVVAPHRTQIVDLAIKNRLPAIYPYLEYVETGGLMSYGVQVNDLHRRAAIYVDRILKGAKPADLPVEQPTKFELVINLKTAKQIGLTIPPNVLARADKVIR
jgi:putative ABC transport system substrate-binding protein